MSDLLKRDTPDAERMEEKPDTIRLGSWHWLKMKTMEGNIEERFVCVTWIGSNYANVETPSGSSWRVHFDKWDDETRPEPNPRTVIDERIGEKKRAVSALMAKVQDVTARLGMTPTNAGETGTALAILSGQTDVIEYKAALEKAKKDELPELFKEIDDENQNLAKWMKADMLPVQAMADRAKLAIKEIENRILNVEIYAGITEEVKEVRKGAPAGADEKLRVLQAKFYMDEECLLDYRGGGMDFERIGDFDRWLAKSEPSPSAGVVKRPHHTKTKKNFERILPFPRCMVAMQVRRKKKDRDEDEEYEGVLGAFLRFKREAFDKWTFLYVRNGARLYRINSKVEFGKLIFPSKDEFTTEPMVFKTGAGDVDFKTVREHEVDQAAAAEKKRLREEWNKENPYKKWRKQKIAERREDDKKELEERKAKGESIPDRLIKQLQKKTSRSDFSRFEWQHANPHGTDWNDPSSYFDSWEPFDKSSVNYDEALATLTKRARQWNRVALMIQGLLDRSEILHPHPKVESWTPEGFASAIELIYDGEHVLHHGEPPDFEAYRAKMNEGLGPDSVTIGQERVWLNKVQNKERRRRLDDYRLKWSEKEVAAWWHPSRHDNKGPGFLSKVAKWKPESRIAVFKWMRDRRGGAHRYGDERGLQIEESIQVDAKSLFNASGYTSGDYLQFFKDSRTRMNYMKWAPILLTCEDWLAGKIKPGEDDE